MGVRGLTTFISKNEENYFKKHKLRDTYVVIDAHSLCAQLYKFYTKSNDSFGGDYDKYARCIVNFFTLLKQCNITPIVIFDGGYEKKKLRTVYMRLKTKIKAVKKASPVMLRGETIFPLFVREVFRDVVLELNVITARCDFEADFEIACIARQLNCPVISYDSDFYIFDVLYIPFPTMDFHTTKIKDGQGSNHYIACKIYKIDTFLKQFGGLDKSLIPLMATVLGNDYIGKGAFRNFYAHLKLTRKKVGERGDQQRQIVAVIKWLQEQNYESAVRKILGRLKKKHRRRIGREITKITKGYICTESEILKFLTLLPEKKPEATEVPDIDVDKIETDSENECESDDSEESTDSEEKLSEDEQQALDTITESKNVDFPEWFKIKYRKAEFPTLFMDLLSLKNCFYMPQVENTRNMYTVDISLPILRTIAKILLHNEESFTYLARNRFGRVKKYIIDISDLKPPTVWDLNTLNEEKRRNILMQVLEMTEKEISVVSQFPKNWHLYLYSLIYWAKKAVAPEITLCHLYSFILCLINLNFVDKQIGYYRAKKVFFKKFATNCSNILHERKNCTNSVEIEDNMLNCYINNVTKDDSIIFANNFINNFELDEKLSTKFKLYDLNTVDSFAQFQSCLYYIKHLNSLLLNPIDDANISSFFNGTFIFNIYANLESRNDINSYIELLLRNSPSIYQLFKSILTLLTSLIDLKTCVKTQKKRKRKRKKAEVNESEENDQDQGCNEIKSEEEEEDIDINNKFSVLRLVN